MKKQVSYRQLFPTVVLLAAFLSLLFSVQLVGAEEAVSSSTSDAAALTENPPVSDASVASQAESASAESGEPKAASTEAVEKEGQVPAAAQVAASGPEAVPNVGTIQGESQTSPYEDKEVQVSNVVVTKTDRYGFYVQDVTPDGNSRTSDALYVVSKEKVDVGDKLSLEGRVKEGYMEDLSVRQGQTFNKPSGSLTVTMLMASKVTKEGKTDLPDPVDIVANMPQDTVDNDINNYQPQSEALDYWESLEGMLTTVKRPRVLGPQYRGDIYLLPEG